MDRTDSVMELYCLLHVCVLSTCRPTTEVFLRMSPFPVQLKFDVRLASETPLVASEDRTSGMDDLGYACTHTHTHTHTNTQHVHMSQIMAVSYTQTHTNTYTHMHIHTQTHTTCAHVSNHGSQLHG